MAYSAPDKTNIPLVIEDSVAPERTEIHFDFTPAPSISTEAATEITTNGTRLNGELTSMGEFTSGKVYFEYGLTTSYGSQTSKTIVSSVQEFSKVIFGLTTNTTYHFRAVFLVEGVVESADQYWYGSDVTLTTLELPTVETDTATDVDSESATLNGELTSLGGYTYADCYFKLFYKVGSVYTLIQETEKQIIPIEDSSGSEIQLEYTFSAEIENLLPNTTYYVYAYAEAGGAIVEGLEETFTTEGGIVETDAPSGVGDTTATLNGELLSLNGETDLEVYFEYGINFEYSTTPQTLSSVGTFSENLSSLEMNTEYAVRAVATDGTLIWYGEVKTFITTFEIIVQTLAPSEVTDGSALAQGSIQLGIDEAEYYFEWGTTTSYGNTTSSVIIVSSLLVDFYLTGLSEFEEYHYRLVVYDSVEDVYYYGNDIQFYTSPEETIVSGNASMSWTFDLFHPDGVTEWGIHWSTKSFIFGSTQYSAKVIPDSFNGISEEWSIPQGLISARDLVFDIDNSDFSLGTPYNPVTESYLEGEIFLIRCIIDGEVIKAWKFKIMRLTFPYGRVKVFCQSLLQSMLQGSWPKTKHPMEIWPSTDIAVTDDYCVPVILGTAYIPVMSVNTGTERHYVLGKSGPTYTIEKVRAPHSRGISEWDSASYTFSQSSDESTRLVQFEIADDGSGIGYDPGVWKDGSTFLMPLCKYTRSDTLLITNPADWISYILRDFGVPSSYLDTGSGSTFEAVKVILQSRGISWNGGFIRKRSREKVLAELLILCDAYIYEGEKLELHLFSRKSVAFITKTIERTFNPTPNTNINLIDGMRVHWIATDAPQDIFPGKSNVAVNPDNGNNVNYPSGTVLEYRFEPSSVNAQKASTLYIQKNTIKNRVSLTTSILEDIDFKNLKPGQVITLFSKKVFRMNYGVIITSLKFSYNGLIDLNALELNFMNDWNDLSPSPISITTDSTPGNMD